MKQEIFLSPERALQKQTGPNMAQSLVKNLVHLVFSTRHRKTWLHAEIRDALFSYQAGIFKQWDSPAVIINGVEDHVHALFSLSKNHALMKIVEEVKRGSSKWLKEQDTQLSDFHWQNGYSGFSVSMSSLENVKSYIANQAEHHQKMSFQDEVRALLKRHELDNDERYLWD